MVHICMSFVWWHLNMLIEEWRRTTRQCLCQLNFTLCRCISACFRVCLCQPVSVSMSQTLSLCQCLCVSVRDCVNVGLSVSHPQPLPLCWCHCVCQSVSVSLSVCICVSHVCVTVCVSVWQTYDTVSQCVSSVFIHVCVRKRGVLTCPWGVTFWFACVRVCVWHHLSPVTCCRPGPGEV